MIFPLSFIYLLPDDFLRNLLPGYSAHITCPVFHKSSIFLFYCPNCIFQCLCQSFFKNRKFFFHCFIADVCFIACNRNTFAQPLSCSDYECKDIVKLKRFTTELPNAETLNLRNVRQTVQNTQSVPTNNQQII